MTAMLAYSGLRRNECMRLHVEDIDVDRGVINLVPRTKTGRLKTEGSAVPIAMPPALRLIVREWLEHRLDCPVGFSLPPAGSIVWIFPGSMRTGPWVGGVTKARPGTRLKTVAAPRGGRDDSPDAPPHVGDPGRGPRHPPGPPEQADEAHRRGDDAAILPATRTLGTHRGPCGVRLLMPGRRGEHLTRWIPLAGPLRPAAAGHRARASAVASTTSSTRFCPRSMG